MSSPGALGSPGMGIEGINRRRKKRTSIETHIRVALEKSFLEVRKCSRKKNSVNTTTEDSELDVKVKTDIKRTKMHEMAGWRQTHLNIF